MRPGPDDRKRLILDAAARLFLHYGHAKTTIADIAREAGIAVGSVYLDFESKEALVEALSSSTHVRVLDAMRQAARKAGPTLAARLPAALEARTAAFLELRREGAHAKEMLHCQADGVKLAREAYAEDERAFFRQLVEDAADAGEIGKTDARRTAALLQRAFATLAPPALFEIDEAEALATAREMADLVVPGIGLGRTAKRRR